MKICILANALSVHAQRWAQAYAKLGHEVHILSIRYFNIPAVKTTPIYLGHRNSKSKLWTFLSYLYLFLSARWRLRYLQPDIVHAHFAPTYGAIAAFSGYHPFVLSVWGSDIIWHNSSPMPWFLSLINRYALKRADMITATSQFLIRRTKAFISSSRKIQHIPFGIDCQYFTPKLSNSLDLDFQEFRIGFVKKLASIYGPDILIKALPLILQEVPQARLIMAGREDQKKQLQRLAKNLGIADKIKFLGFVPHEQVPPLLNTFFVFVNPSICQESFGVSILEASACEIPVVATKVGGVPEVCLDQQTGFLVPPNDPKSLARVIIQLAHNVPRRRQIGQAARNFVLNRYQWQNNVNEMIHLFNQLINSKHDKPSKW